MSALIAQDLTPIGGLVMTVTVRIDYDQDTENPCEYDGWQVHSFNTRHASFKHPDEFGIRRDGTSSMLAIQNKLRAGTAFVLGYYEHSLCQWALSGEQHNCPWDSVSVAGVLIWEQPVKNLGPKTYKNRQEDARNFLRTYTDWCNGQCFYYCIETGNEVVDSCGGYIGADDVTEAVREALKANDIAEDQVKFIGEAAEVMT